MVDIECKHDYINVKKENMIKHYKFKTKPYAHQLEALEKSWAQESYGLFMEMGTGKSKVLVDNMAMLYDKGAIRGALIVAPKGVYKNWNDIEFPVHLPDHVEHTKVLWEPNITKKKHAYRQLHDRPSLEHIAEKIHRQNMLPVNFRSDRRAICPLTLSL